MLPQEIIRKKRSNIPLSTEEINFFVQGITKGDIADCQIGAFTMATYLNGLSVDETTDLTVAMRNSGDILQWNGFDKPIVDKHSSGGVGDKVSLMLAPILASCGVFVPMISGRGLGHTGGTLDKFDSIPGYQTNPDNDLFKQTVKEVGCAIIGQTNNLAPADKKIYAVRDVCATVESLYLITASILSKKLAAGLEYLIMDLKFGNGAFMNNIEDGIKLAKLIVKTASKLGTKTQALLTDMNQVLGTTVGNALEVKEAIDFLKNKNINKRLYEVTTQLASHALVNAKIFKNHSDAMQKVEENIKNGKALEIFAKMVAKLGGKNDFVEKHEQYLAKAKIIRPIFAKTNGYIKSMNTRNIGLAIIELKGGRSNPTQKLDFATGFSDFCQIGDYVDEQQPLAFVHAQNEDDFIKASNKIIENIKISSQKPLINPVIAKII